MLTFLSELIWSGELRAFLLDYSLYGGVSTRVSSCSLEAIYSHSSLTKPASQSNNPVASIRVSPVQPELSSQDLGVQFVVMLVVVNTSPVWRRSK